MIFPVIGSKIPVIYLLQILGSVLDSIIFVTFGKLHTCRLHMRGRIWRASTLWAMVFLVNVALAIFYIQTMLTCAHCRALH